MNIFYLIWRNKQNGCQAIATDFLPLVRQYASVYRDFMKNCVDRAMWRLPDSLNAALTDVSD